MLNTASAAILSSCLGYNQISNKICQGLTEKPVEEHRFTLQGCRYFVVSSARGLMLSSTGETGPRSIRMDFLGLCVDCEVGFGQVIEKST